MAKHGKPIINHPFGNGKHTYKHGDDWGMVYGICRWHRPPTGNSLGDTDDLPMHVLDNARHGYGMIWGFP